MNLAAPITALELSVRGTSSLLGEYSPPAHRKPIETVGELVAMTGEELRRLPNLGERTLADIRSGLAVHGLYLRGEGPNKAPPDRIRERATLALRLQAIEVKLDYIIATLEVKWEPGPTANARAKCSTRQGN